MIRPVAITPGAMQFTVIPNGPEIPRQISCITGDTGLRGSIMCLAGAGPHPRRLKSIGVAGPKV
jgi:hypothetical protein